MSDMRIIGCTASLVHEHGETGCTLPEGHEGKHVGELCEVCLDDGYDYRPKWTGHAENWLSKYARGR